MKVSIYLKKQASLDDELAILIVPDIRKIDRYSHPGAEFHRVLLAIQGETITPRKSYELLLKLPY